MTSFAAAGASCFLQKNSSVRDQYGPNPNTSRGEGTIVNFHPKENRIIYASGKLIVVKNLDMPGDTFIYRGHNAPATVAKFSTNGFWVASGDSSGKLRVWSWDNPEHLLKLETLVFAGPILDIDWDSESKKLMLVGENAGLTVKCITWDTGNSVGEMVGHNKKVLSGSYRPTRPFRIMSGGEDFRTIFYSGPPFKFTHSNSSHTNFVNCVRYAPDGTKIASVGSDKKIQLYDGATAEPTISVADAHAGGVYSVAFSPDSSKLATASADKTIKVWDSSNLANLFTLSPSTNPQMGDMQVTVMWTNLNIVSISLNGDINIFRADGTASQPVKVIQANQVSITAMALDVASSTLYAGSFDGVVCAHNLATGVSRKLRGQDAKSLSGAAHSGKITGLALAGGEVVSVGWDDCVRFCTPLSSEVPGSGAYLASQALAGQPAAMASPADGSVSGVFAVVTNAEFSLYRGRDKTASLIRPAGFSGQCVAVFGVKEIVVGGDDNKSHVYKVAGSLLEEVACLAGRAPVSAVAYSLTGDLLAVGDTGRQIEVFDRSVGWAPKINSRWISHSSLISALAWSPSGQYLASGSLDESIIVWDYSSPTKKKQFSFAHRGGVTGLAWLNDNMLVSCGNDHTIVTWNVQEF